MARGDLKHLLNTPPFLLLPVPANAIAAQLLRVGKYKDADFKSTRLITKKVLDRWKTPTVTPVNISGDFTAAEFAAALQHANQGKASAPEFIF